MKIRFVNGTWTFYPLVNAVDRDKTRHVVLRDVLARLATGLSPDDMLNVSFKTAMAMVCVEGTIRWIMYRPVKLKQEADPEEDCLILHLEGYSPWGPDESRD